MDIKRIKGNAIGPYSSAVVVGNFVFISGQLPLNCEGKIRVNGIREQTRQILDNISEILKEAGSSIDKVVNVKVYLTDINDFNYMNEVFEEYFKEAKPSRTTVVVQNLPKDSKIEMDAIAVI